MGRHDSDDDRHQRRKHRTRSRSPVRRRDRDRDYDRRDRHRDYDKRDRDRDYDRHSRREVKREPEDDYHDEKPRRKRSPSPGPSRKRGATPIKDRKRKMSVSSTSSEGSDAGERELDMVLEKRRQEKLERRKIEKAKMKEMETPEEKRIRRLAKKMRKEDMRKIQMSNNLTYNNLNNPFNDTKLTEAFVWGKKYEKEGKKLKKHEIEAQHTKAIQKNYEEIENQRRQREARQAIREDNERMNREKDREGTDDFRRIEMNFHINQTKERTKLRLAENRAQPIDYLVRYSVFGDDQDEHDYGQFDLVRPLTYIKGLTIDQFEDLVADIKLYKSIANGKNADFWDDMRTICESELIKLKDKRRREEMEEAVHSSVKEDVTKIFKNKNFKQLVELEESIRERLKSDNSPFWQSLHDQIHPYMARARLEEQYNVKRKLKMQRMREQQAKEMDEHAKMLGDQKPVMLPAKANTDAENESKTDTNVVDDEEDLNDTEAARSIALKSIKFTLDELLEMDDDIKEQQWSSLTPTQLDAFTRHIYVSGRYSPTLNAESEAMPRIAIINEADDVKELEEKRDINRHGHKSGNAPMTAEEAAMLDFAKQGMSKEEEVFSEEATLEKQTFLWADKYRPRKPRYFNRVHTGFDWNKYNQTHYDLDNPPPKIVQGYRFYIFYPDLLDITKTPKYTLTECDDPDFAILRFTAGPPYEDIAFKIVHREWEINHKHGFRNQFKDGVFQLWFSFKRYRYRR